MPSRLLRRRTVVGIHGDVRLQPTTILYAFTKSLDHEATLVFTEYHDIHVLNFLATCAARARAHLIKSHPEQSGSVRGDRR